MCSLVRSSQGFPAVHDAALRERKAHGAATPKGAYHGPSNYRLLGVKLDPVVEPDGIG
jgi:hypothetical protein